MFSCSWVEFVLFSMSQLHSRPLLARASSPCLLVVIALRRRRPLPLHHATLERAEFRIIRANRISYGRKLRGRQLGVVGYQKGLAHGLGPAKSLAVTKIASLVRILVKLYIFKKWYRILTIRSICARRELQPSNPNAHARTHTRFASDRVSHPHGHSSHLEHELK